jgi:hypothetical protein
LDNAKTESLCCYDLCLHFDNIKKIKPLCRSLLRVLKYLKSLEIFLYRLQIAVHINVHKRLSASCSASMPSDRKRERSGSQAERYEAFKMCLCVVPARADSLPFACRISKYR